MSASTLSPGLRAWRQRAKNAPWLGSALAAAVAFVITIANGQIQGIPGLLAAALSFSALTVLVALGQMLVISTGPGNADLSIPSAIALSSTVSMLVMDGSDAMVLPGLLAAMGVGAAVGLLNFGLIRLLRIPPIIATLANSLIVMSCAISFGHGLKIKPPPIFIELVTLRLGGIPLLALAVSVLVWLVVERTVRTSLLAYVICAALAELTGALIEGFAGGNSLDQGDVFAADDCRGGDWRHLGGWRAPLRARVIRSQVLAQIDSELSAVKPHSAQSMQLKVALQAQGIWSQYLEVGIGPDAEVFTKALMLPSVGTFSAVNNLAARGLLACAHL